MGASPCFIRHRVCLASSDWELTLLEVLCPPGRRIVAPRWQIFVDLRAWQPLTHLLDSIAFVWNRFPPVFYIYAFYIYIYAFSRRFYPKRLTLHSSYSFYILSALAFPGNRTHDLSVASAMLYQLSYRRACFSLFSPQMGRNTKGFQVGLLKLLQRVCTVDAVQLLHSLGSRMWWSVRCQTFTQWIPENRQRAGYHMLNVDKCWQM